LQGQFAQQGYNHHKVIDLDCSPHPDLVLGVKRYWFGGLGAPKHIFMIMGDPEGHGGLVT
jgi:hypothetical protein